MQLREFCFNSCQRIPRSCWYIDQVKYSSFVAALFPFSSCHSCDLHSASLCLTPGSAQWSSMKSDDISSNCQQCYSTSHFPRYVSNAPPGVHNNMVCWNLCHFGSQYFYDFSAIIWTPSSSLKIGRLCLHLESSINQEQASHMCAYLYFSSGTSLMGEGLTLLYELVWYSSEEMITM
jgi:hypothetical protein